MQNQEQFLLGQKGKEGQKLVYKVIPLTQKKFDEKILNIVERLSSKPFAIKEIVNLSS